jgi:hypothetical protein
MSTFGLDRLAHRLLAPQQQRPLASALPPISVASAVTPSVLSAPHLTPAQRQLLGQGRGLAASKPMDFSDDDEGDSELAELMNR